MSREPRGIGTTLLPWPRGQETTGSGPCMSPNRVHQFILRQHLGTAVEYLPNSWWGQCRAPEGPPGCPTAGPGWEVSGCAVVRGRTQLPLPDTALAPNSPPWVRVWLGCEAQPSQSPLVLGSTVPRPDPARTGAQGGSLPVGCPGGRLRRAPLRPSQLWGRRLPTCLPLAVVFPPELQICLGFAVIWPGARLGRPAQPAGCGPAAGGSRGCGWGAEPGPPLGLGVLGSWDRVFWAIFAGVIVLVPGLKHHCGVPVLLLSQLLPPAQRASRGDSARPCVRAATGIGTHEHPLPRHLDV